MSLEIWEAVRFESISGAGRTQPLVLECERSGEDGKPESGLFVVKSLGHPNVFESTLFTEAFGNSLARCFGIATPQPAFVALSPAFNKAFDFELRGDWGVGCAYMPPLNPLPPEFGLNANLLPQATMIYAFDSLANNPDRSFNNPNCALQSGKLVAYDFDCAFGRIPSDCRPWHASKIGNCETHLFRNRLAEEAVVWTPCGIELRKLTEPDLNAMVKDYPFQIPSDFDRICDHLLTVQENEARWLQELTKSVRTLNLN